MDADKPSRRKVYFLVYVKNMNWEYWMLVTDHPQLDRIIYKVENYHGELTTTLKHELAYRDIALTTIDAYIQSLK